MQIGFPFAAVLISTAFLVLVSVVQFIGLDPHFLNGAIYYGTLYGPFYLAYQATNHTSNTVERIAASVRPLLNI